MTLAEAQEILKSPKFGDPMHIAAVARVEREPQLHRLKVSLLGYENQESCPVCSAFNIQVTQEMLDTIQECEPLWLLREGLGLDENDD